ncbi:DUF6474 family protein [Actinopolyspora mortivallis]|uniref:DUF6474 family protein n=1 Tax=Actinopolyspora mortivallis TaxID=33906 RepID=UPI000376F5E2|nr:DUF6474 family protein [Actinopolyspora mortivallis]
MAGSQRRKHTADTTRAERRARRAQRREERGRRREERRTAKAARKGEHGRLTPGNAKKVVGVTRIVGPVVAPYLARAAATAREGYERFRARRLGVAVEDVSRFTGRGAALHARIAGDATALENLLASRGGTEDEESVRSFVESSRQRLNELSGVVRAAERMPAARRRAAHRAVDGELGRIEDDLLRRFGVRA